MNITDVNLRALIRPVFEEFYATLAPPIEYDTVPLQALYQLNVNLFMPIDLEDEERLNPYFKWYARPEKAYPFFRLYVQSYDDISFRSLLCEYIINPIDFLCSFNNCLNELSDSLLWEYKSLLLKNLSRPHYAHIRQSDIQREVCPDLNHNNYPFLFHLDKGLDFNLLWSTRKSPQCKLTTELRPQLLKSRVNASSSLDRSILSLCELDLHYRIVFLLSSYEDVHALLGSNFKHGQIFQLMTDEMKHHILSFL